MIHRRILLALTGAAAMAMTALPTMAQNSDPVRIAFIDPLSGLLATVGESNLKHLQFAAEKVNERGGVLGGRKLEIVPFDGKASAQESVTQLRAALDQGIRIVTQGNGTSVALALIEAVDRHNQRNPGQEVIYLNNSAVDPVLTNDKCSYWHWQFDSNTTMKLTTLVRTLAKDTNVKKVFLINQDYAFGQGFSAEAKRLLKESRPDIEIVGDDFHPLGRVTDFSPYVAKIKASGAQAVFTGNWGSDLALLIRAGSETGLNVNYYTFYGHVVGAPTAIGPAGVGRVRTAVPFHDNLGHEINNPELVQLTEEFRKKYNLDFYAGYFTYMVQMLANSIEKAGGTDMKKVAAALHTAELNTPAGVMKVRQDNHQIETDFVVAVLERGVPIQAEGIGAGWKTEAKFPARDISMPTTCKMKVPS
ncbi:MAG TPA: branched-chain amino acid ABC transporter substrate-binding protein [Azospirillaceae bacterium]|nr:branched-chain amino acid ABC transporter substrate-binding protein [Azospirillaceae bacterium]